MTFVDEKEGPALNRWKSSYLPDVDECSLNTHDCHSHAICTNTEGSFTCKCDVNAHYIGDGKTCTPHRKPNYNVLLLFALVVLPLWQLLSSILWKSYRPIFMSPKSNLSPASRSSWLCLSKSILLMKFQMHRKRDLFVYFFGCLWISWVL